MGRRRGLTRFDAAAAAFMKLFSNLQLPKFHSSQAVIVRQRLEIMYGAGMKGRTRVSNVGTRNRPQSKSEPEKNLWSSLLNGVASGKKLPEKNLLVLGQFQEGRQKRWRLSVNRRKRGVTEGIS